MHGRGEDPERAAKGARNPKRSLFTFIDLPTYLEEENPLTSPRFTDHRGEKVSLVPATFPIAAQQKAP